MNKKYRFFYHFNKKEKKMTVHFKGTCYIYKHIICEPETQTHYKSTQPHLVMRGWCSGIVEGNGTDTIVIKN